MTTRHHGSAHDRKKSHHAAGSASANGRMDPAIYIAYIMVGVFLILLAAMVFAIPWQHAALGYVIALALLVNYSAWKAYLGRELEGWQKPLARLPLRYAGFGASTGHPLHAAKGEPKAKLVLLVCLAISALLIAGASLLLIRN